MGSESKQRMDSMRWRGLPNVITPSGH